MSAFAVATTGHQETPDRWLLTGASGMIGQALAAALQGRGIPSLQAVRVSAGQHRPPGTIAWNPQQARPFAELPMLEGLDVAVHLSGANVAGHRWTAAYKQEIVTSRTQTTAGLARTLASLRQPPRLLITASATGFYGDRGDAVLTEACAPGDDFLAETCQAWEAAAAPAVEAGIAVVYLRLGVVLTPKGGALAKVLPLFRAGLGGRMGSGRQWMSWITLDDAIGAFLHVAGVEKTAAADSRAVFPAGPVNCVTPAPVTNREYTRILAATLGKPAFAAAPAFALRLALGEMADGALLSSCRALPEKLLASGFEFRFPELGPALEHLLTT